MTLLFAVISIGCDNPPPKPKAELPKGTIRLEPEAVDADAPEEFTTSESGLKYRIRRKSDGKKPGPTDIVRIHYRGRLSDGAIFASTYGKFGAAEYFEVSNVVKGWSEGMQLVGEGGMIELVIPPELGYGEGGFAASNPPIPPNDTLNMIIEMLEIVPRPANAPAAETHSHSPGEPHSHGPGESHSHGPATPEVPGADSKQNPEQKTSEDSKKEQPQVSPN